MLICLLNDSYRRMVLRNLQQELGLALLLTSLRNLRGCDRGLGIGLHAALTTPLGALGDTEELAEGSGKGSTVQSLALHSVVGLPAHTKGIPSEAKMRKALLWSDLRRVT